MEKSTVQIEITGFAYGGASFGKLPDGRICFVRGGAPGDFVEVEIISEKKKYANAGIVKFIRESSDRIRPECEYALSAQNTVLTCPGCSYQHVPYDVELKWKQAEFEGFMVHSRLTDSDKISQPVPSPVRYGWRNKIKLSFSCTSDGEPLLGYIGDDNQTIVPIKRCALARKSINQMLEKYSQTQLDKQKTHSVYFRWTLADGVVSWVNNKPERTSCLTEQLGAFGKFLVPCQSFFQTNTAVAAELIKKVISVIRDNNICYLADLYCGCGIFSISAASVLENLQCMGIELDQSSVDAARRNAKMRGLSQKCRIYTGDTSKILLEHIGKMDMSQTAFLVDPPRNGLNEKVITDMISVCPKMILYVSCASDTLQRDAQKLIHAGYEIRQTGIFDMFPATAHFESLTVFQKCND